VCEPCSESGQETLDDDGEEEDSKGGIVHKRTLYNLCGIHNGDEVKIEEVFS
jgi:hypothetical protein